MDSEAMIGSAAASEQQQASANEPLHRSLLTFMQCGRDTMSRAFLCGQDQDVPVQAELRHLYRTRLLLFVCPVTADKCLHENGHGTTVRRRSSATKEVN